jgi:hypothetical protein
MSDPITDGIVSLFHVEDFQIIEGKFFEETLDWYFVEELNAYGIRSFLHYTSRKSAEIELEKVLLKTIQDNLLEISTKEFSIETLRLQNETLKTRLTLLTTSKEI